MNSHLQSILNFIQQSEHLTDEEKTELLKSAKAADKELEITSFKLERTEKVKHTTAILLEETIEELEQKRKAVEAQNRELEIETSLERVRTVAMSMNKPDDLQSICEILFNELKSLGFDEIRNALITTYEDEKDYFLDYDYSDATGGNLTKIPFQSHQLLEKFRQQILSTSDAFAEFPVSGDELKDWKEARRKNGEPDDPRLENIDTLYYYFYSIGSAAIGFSNFSSISDDKRVLLKRFRNVFDLAYKRYIDITNAEAQARESQIQLALERVRARTMAMQRSEELGEAAILLFKQVSDLGIKAWTTGFNVWSDDNNFYTDYITSPQGNLIKAYTIDARTFTVFKEFSNAKKRGEEFLVQYLEGDLLKEAYKALSSFGDEKQYEKMLEDGFEFPSHQYNHYVFGSKVSLMFITYEPVPEAHDIFKRFAKVFEQTYTRFLDLQKAEAQARESQIEAALERVRSRSVGMQKSEELHDVIQVVYDQLIQLNFKIDNAGFLTDPRQSDDYNIWAADANGVLPTQLHIPYFDHPFTRDYIDQRDKEVELFAKTYSFEEKNSWWETMFKSITGTPEEIKETLIKIRLESPGLALSRVFMKNIGLYLLNFSGTPYSEAENDTLMRFAKAFEQTYIRFNDLKKAEAQTLEAIKRASVDRVRAEIASMRTTSDLERITPLVWNELTTLGVPFIRCGVFIMDEETEQIHTFLSTPEGKAIATLHVPFDFNLPLIANGVDHWRKGEIYREHWDAATFIKSWAALSALSETSTASPQNEHPPENLYLHQLPFLQGMLYVGSEVPLTEDELQLSQNLADAFSTAYARYEDFNKLEAAKKQVDSALNELQATQKQLVQSEKMASLGELTAGIAHEIQNPLNFVNNFSEVNQELLVEMKDEMDKGNIDDAREIANDVIANEEKINHHGKRADAIVKGMLQHSRSSTGVKEPTDINALADEYLRLSYHGLRAKDKNFNAEIKTDFDESVGSINIIPQDIGRVLLNLFNNAFYAVNEQKSKNLIPYEPTVSVTTKKSGNSVLITVSDNGNGIPQKVVDKIFQPFFTTKPTGQGTGLGLSLSYDIVKAHGGEIKVETKESVGTTFIISLPV